MSHLCKAKGRNTSVLSFTHNKNSIAPNIDP